MSPSQKSNTRPAAQSSMLASIPSIVGNLHQHFRPRVVAMFEESNHKQGLSHLSAIPTNEC
jgi:hypothetical protein